VDPSELADQAAEHDDRQRSEQPVGERVLAARLAAGERTSRRRTRRSPAELGSTTRFGIGGPSLLVA
jgi:hypothetical protein